MNRIHVRLAVVFYALLVTPARADLPEPPVIQVTSQVRSVRLLLQSEGIEPGSQASHSDSASGNGPYVMGFVDAVSGEEGTLANGNTAQDSRITQFQIKGNGNGDGSATANVVSTSAAADAGSGIQIEFQVPVKAAFSLAGSIEATTAGMGGGGIASIWVTGTDSLGTPFVIYEAANAQTGPDPVEFFHVQSVMEGTTILLAVNAQSVVTTSGTGTVSGTSRYNFTLDFGDRDGDGLLDAWETDGIDVDDDGIPEIDLAAEGANPDHKDLFIELDAMAGIAVNTDAIDDVVVAFDAAPAGMIDNPDGNPGVTLHVMIDETNLARQILAGSPWPSGFDALKNEHFGTTTDRQHSNWTDLKKARAKIFRYCLWADSLVASGDTTTTGRAERPGDDFIVAAGYITNVFPQTSQNALAGTFMHELGHTLGLRHGGTDTINYKPNYVSAMNYAHQGLTPDVAPIHVLDYSRSLIRLLDEGALMEPLGVNGPADRFVYFNKAPDGQPPLWGIVRADSAPVDWNGDTVDDLQPVVQDINRLHPDSPAAPGEVLRGSIDWNHLWYHLSGNGNFSDGGRVMGSITIELNDDELRELSTVSVEYLAPVSTAGRTLPTTATFALLPATPNPFNPTTEIRFRLPRASRVELNVYDLRGRLVRSLEDGGLVAAGSHVRVWDGKDRRGRSLASGVYFYRLVAGDFRSTRAVTLLK